MHGSDPDAPLEESPDGLAATESAGDEQPLPAGWGRLTAGLRSVPRTVWLVTALWCSLLLGASLVWPMVYGLDEAAHIDMAYDYAAHPFHFYGPGQLQYSNASVALQHSLPGIPPKTRLATAPIPPRSQRPTFAQLGGHTLQSGGTPNQMDEHPPLYYWMEAVVLHIPGVSSLPWDLSVWLMRLLSVLIMSPVPLLCWAAARRLISAPFGWLDRQRASRLALLAAALPLTVPNLIRVGSSVDNDALLVLTTTVVLYLMTRVITGDLGSGTAAWLAIALAAALWTKGFALALPLLILIAYAFAARRFRPAGPAAPAGPTGVTAGPAGPTGMTAVRAVARPVLIVAVGAVVGGAWWLRNLIDYHTVQPDGFGLAFTEKVIYGPPDHKGTFTRFILPYLDGFTSRLWGEIAIPDIPSPGPLVVWGWFFVTVIGVAAALLIRSTPGGRRRLGVLLLTALVYLLITMEGSFSTFRKWSRIGPQAVQGRYVYGAVLAVAVAFAIGWFKLVRPRFHARLAPIVVVGAILTNAAAWLLIIRSWYTPVANYGWISGTRTGIDGLLRWSPAPSAVTVLVVIAVPLLLSVVCAVAVTRDARDAGDPLDPLDPLDAVDLNPAGAPAIGTPAIGTPAIGTPAIGTPAIGALVRDPDGLALGAPPAADEDSDRLPQ